MDKTQQSFKVYHVELTRKRVNGTQAVGEAGLFHLAVLTVWDNILGPCPLVQWNLVAGDGENQTEFKIPSSEKFLPYLANHTLNGEICRDFSTGNIDVKISTFTLTNINGTNQQLSSVTFVFSCQTQGGPSATHAFALIFPALSIEKYLAVHEIVNLRMKRMLRKFQVLCERGDLRQTAMECVKAELQALDHFIVHWMATGIHHPINIKDTYFSRSRPCDKGFLRRALASHLVTGGSSVVVGSCPHTANLMIGSLALLLNDKERRMCTYLQPTQYFPGLHIQGILKAFVEGEDALGKVFNFSGRFPIAIIDMDSKKIRRTSSLCEHQALRHKMLKAELEDLFGGHCEADSPIKAKCHGSNVDETMVEGLLAMIDKIEGEENEQSIKSAIVQWRLNLDSRAKVFMKLVSCLYNEPGRNDKDPTACNSNRGSTDHGSSDGSNDHVSSHRGSLDLSHGVLKNFLDNHLWNSKGDLDILVSTSERLCPGFNQTFQDKVPNLTKKGRSL